MGFIAGPVLVLVVATAEELARRALPPLVLRRAREHSLCVGAPLCVCHGRVGVPAAGCVGVDGQCRWPKASETRYAGRNGQGRGVHGDARLLRLWCGRRPWWDAMRCDAKRVAVAVGEARDGAESSGRDRGMAHPAQGGMGTRYSTHVLCRDSAATRSQPTNALRGRMQVPQLFTHS